MSKKTINRLYFDDEYLVSCSFSREEIRSGLKEIAKLSGMEWLVETY